MPNCMPIGAYLNLGTGMRKGARTRSKIGVGMRAQSVSDYSLHLLFEGVVIPMCHAGHPTPER
jgi:hypothetical protein